MEDDSKLDKLLDEHQRTQIKLERTAGTIELIKQRFESVEVKAALEKQVVDRQIQRLEGTLQDVKRDVDVVKTQITKAQGMFAIIASVVVFVVGFLQQLIAKAIGLDGK